VGEARHGATAVAAPASLAVCLVAHAGGGGGGVDHEGMPAHVDTPPLKRAVGGEGSVQALLAHIALRAGQVGPNVYPVAFGPAAMPICAPCKLVRLWKRW